MSNDKIGEVFGIESLKENQTNALTVRKETGIIKKEIQKTSEDDGDYEEVRENLKELIMKSTGALDDLLDLARDSQHPKAYEVLSQLLTTIKDQNLSLIDIQTKIKGTKKEEPKGDTNIQNAVFVGSTANLLKALRDQENGIES